MHPAAVSLICLALASFDTTVASLDDRSNDGEPARTLRSQKINVIWNKARKRISDEQLLEKLAAELQVLDDEYMVLKKTQSEDGDPLGEVEASLLTKTEAILHNYDLWDYFKNAHEKHDTFETEASREAAVQRLDSLVDKARQAGFTEEELVDLRTEIEHHKKKMDEYEQLQMEYEEAARKTNRIPDSMEDSSHAYEEHDKLRTALKRKHKDIRHGFEKLKVLSENPVPLKDVGFTDAKLIRLWAEALKANFTAPELQSLKVELSHLQEKMLKHAALKEEASLVKKQLKKQGKAEAAADSSELWRTAAEQHEQLSNQADEYGNLVKKYVRDIKAKIKDARLRTEL